MREEIEPYLNALEEALDIQVVGAWDTGSRARGLQTEGSDYDISICFTQPKSNYVIEEEYINSIDDDASEFIQDQEESEIPLELVEFSGWDIKRFFELVRQYKQSAFDCFSSPIRYRQHPAFNMCGEYCIEHVHPIEAYNRFKSAAGYNYETYLEDGSDPTVKRNLFIVESILRARYIEYTHDYPPINFFVLLEDMPEEAFIEFDETEARSLAERKLDGEGYAEIGNPYAEQIGSFLNYELDYENHIPESKISSDELNEYIRLILAD